MSATGWCPKCTDPSPIGKLCWHCQFLADKEREAMTQPTDEAAVDIVATLRASADVEDGPGVMQDFCFGDDMRQAADEIETLRAQLTAATTESRRFKALADDHFRNAQQIAERHTAATRRAEQAERMLAEQRALLTAPIMAGYAMHYGGRCRDCADQADGICENTGLPCAGRRKATMFVCEALEYGFSHNFVDPQYAIRSAAGGEQG